MIVRCFIRTFNFVIFLTLLVVCSTGASLDALASGSQSGCPRRSILVLLRDEVRLRRAVKLRSSWLENHQSVESLDVVDGGWRESPGWTGRVRTVRRPLLGSWNSAFGGDRANAAGDTRRTIFNFGERVGRFFGNSIVSTAEMTIPSGQRAQEAVSAINRRTPGLIRVGFYDAPAKMGEEEYLSRFARDGALPIADEFALHVHDVNFHISAIALPANVVSLSMRQTDEILNLARYLRQEMPHQPEIERLIEEIIHTQTGRVDAGNGNFSGSLSSWRPIGFFPTTVPLKPFDMGFEKFARNGASPDRVISEIRGDIVRRGMSLELKTRLLNLIDRFGAQRLQTDPQYSQGIPCPERSCMSTFYFDVNRQRREIIRAVDEIDH